MRLLLSTALLLLACSPDSGEDRPAQSAPSSSSTRGPDHVVLRLPRAGGVARAYLIGKLDSALWTSEASAPAPAEVLAFDPDAGSLAYVDTRGVARRLDLRLGGIGTAAPASAKLASFSSADGSAIFALAPAGNIVRLTPSGEAWSFAPEERVREVFPQEDGTLIAVTRRRAETVLWRLQPPADRVLDTAVVAVGSTTVRTQVGDRIYFGTDSGLVGVRTRNLEAVPSIAMENTPRALASTPSGDRIFVVTDAAAVSVIDRYRDQVTQTIELPGTAKSLRMDPLGRYLLVQPETGDYAWVVAVGTSRLLGAARTKWLADLPLVTPDGTLLLVQSGDVVIADAETLRERSRVRNGASDFWTVMVWNGFRPRPPGLDEPVRFAGADSAAADSTDSTRVDSASTDTAVATETPASPPGEEGYVVSFASFPSESRARDVAGAIKVRGESPRVVPARVGVTMVYRVVMGPYASRTEAERIGRESGHTYWVFEASP